MNEKTEVAKKTLRDRAQIDEVMGVRICHFTAPVSAGEFELMIQVAAELLESTAEDLIFVGLGPGFTLTTHQYNVAMAEAHIQEALDYLSGVPNIESLVVDRTKHTINFTQLGKSCSLRWESGVWVFRLNGGVAHQGPFSEVLMKCAHFLGYEPWLWALTNLEFES